MSEIQPICGPKHEMGETKVDCDNDFKCGKCPWAIYFLSKKVNQIQSKLKTSSSEHRYYGHTHTPDNEESFNVILNFDENDGSTILSKQGYITKTRGDNTRYLGWTFDDKDNSKASLSGLVSVEKGSISFDYAHFEAVEK